MNRREAGRLGGKATFAKYGKEHMKHIGSLGFQATIISLATKQNISPTYKGNPFRNLLHNLIHAREYRMDKSQLSSKIHCGLESNNKKKRSD